MTQTKKLTIASLMVALGVLFPLLITHSIGIPGTVLLPMHIPVLLCGLLCGARYGALCGAITPLLSSVLTGMPPAFPMLPVMMAQLLVMGLVVGLLHKHTTISRVFALASAVISGLLTYALVFNLLILFGANLKAFSIFAVAATGAPGIVLQLVGIPLLFAIIQRLSKRHSAAVEHQQASAPVSSALEERRTTDDPLVRGVTLIQSGDANCVIIKDNTIVHTALGRGVSPLVQLHQNAPETLRDALIVDKVIGKAAALFARLDGASAVHGLVMSEPALAYLTKHNITATHDRLVTVIASRDGKGVCPIEQSVLEIEDPQAGYDAIMQTIAVLMQRK